MLVFAASDKGGTGRSVTSVNVCYRRAITGGDVCYVDFDFGSPTAGAIFEVGGLAHGTPDADGLHSYLHGEVTEPRQVDVWAESDRSGLRDRPAGAGRLALLPGDLGGGEFPAEPAMVNRCVELFLRLAGEFEFCLVDLSAGRSYATELVLAATADPALRGVVSRWLVFHRWTPQHIIAASGLVFGDNGIVAVGSALKHDRAALERSVRFVRTAVVDPRSPELAGLRPAQVSWLHERNAELKQLAGRLGVGRTAMIGEVPLDPVLQWREQIISDNDVWPHDIANAGTLAAFEALAGRLVDDSAWETL